MTSISSKDLFFMFFFYLHQISGKNDFSFRRRPFSCFWFSFNFGDGQGLREGGAGGDNDPGAHELERGRIEIALSNKRNHLISAGKTVEISVKTFFWKSLNFGRKNSRDFGEDLSFFGDHLISAGGPSNLRGPITSYLSSRGGPSNLRVPIHV